MQRLLIYIVGMAVTIGSISVLLRDELATAGFIGRLLYPYIQEEMTNSVSQGPFTTERDPNLPAPFLAKCNLEEYYDGPEQLGVFDSSFDPKTMSFNKPKTSNENRHLHASCFGPNATLKEASLKTLLVGAATKVRNVPTMRFVAKSLDTSSTWAYRSLCKFSPRKQKGSMFLWHQAPTYVIGGANCGGTAYFVVDPDDLAKVINAGVFGEGVPPYVRESLIELAGRFSFVTLALFLLAALLAGVFSLRRSVKTSHVTGTKALHSSIVTVAVMADLLSHEMNEMRAKSIAMLLGTLFATKVDASGVTHVARGCAKTTRASTQSFIFGDVDPALHPVLVATAVEVMIEEGALSLLQYEFLHNLCTALGIGASEFNAILHQEDAGLFQAA